MSLTARSSSLVENKRTLLAERLKQMARGSAGAPLSFSQQRLWFLDQLQPGSPLYNVASMARLSGPLQPEVLERAINTIIQRHEALRTRFEQVGEMPVQVVDRYGDIKLKLFDLASVREAERERKTSELVKRHVHQPFDLARDRLIRVILIRHSSVSHVLLVVMHHIISDEWSLKVFFSELGTAYEGILGGASSKLSELPIQYSDFAAWQRKWMRGETLEKQLSFWKTHLGGEPPTTEFPLDRPRSSVPEFKGATVIRVLNNGTLEALKSLVEEERSTLFMGLLAGLKCLVCRYTGSADVIIGSPIAGRNRLEAESLIGFFVNTLPLRTDLQGNPGFREVLKRVRQTTLEAFAHQDLPLERLVEEIRPERSMTHMPFTNLMFTLQSNVLERSEFGGLKLEFEDVEADMAKFDLTLTAQARSNGMVLRAEYDVALFNRDTVERALEHLENLLTAAAANPDLPLSDLPLMSAEESRTILEAWNRTTTCYPADKGIHEIFEQQAASSPGAVALQFGERRITYGELNTRANQVAHYLRRLGIGPDVPVAICVHRSPELIVGILGILKAGGAYVPLDSTYPKERLDFMMRDAQATVLLTEQGLLAEIPETGGRTLCLDSDWELLAGEPRHNPVNSCKSDHLAYIMYTSGSTGVPKGVCIPHRAVARLVLNTNYIQVAPEDRIAQVSNVSFDAATFEIWGALLNGAQLIKIEKDVALSPADFAQEIKRQEISALFLTTALFNQLANDVPGAFATVGTVMFGGELCDVKSIRKVLRQQPPRRLLHVYGPTENTTFSTWHPIESLEPDGATVPIGTAISNTQVFVLDPHLKPVPAGIPGELYVGGDGLARGYWNRPELTQRCFVPNPFRGIGGEKLYRTGDLVKWQPGGKLEFLGRVDNQVKIRGFRVEPGEIETVLAQHEAVRECVVSVHGSESRRRLVAYIVPEAGRQVNSSEIRAFLKQKLPDYMVPGAFVAMDTLPLNQNGKVNRKALPAPDMARPELEHGYVAPRDEVERKVAEIYETVLGVHPVGVHDKFFDLGGHSLLAVRLVSKIEKTFGRKLRLATIFQASTVGQLAAILREDVGEASFTSKTSIVEIQTKGTRPPLFLVHGAGGGMFWGYVNLSRHLGQDQPVYGFRSRGLDGMDEFETIEDLAAHYIKDLKRFQPRGPYYLGGYCFGGNVAYEMACQLESAGDEVAVLGLINASPANSKYLHAPWTPIWAARFAKNLVYWSKYCMSWSASQRREFITWKLGILRRRIQRLRNNGNGRLDLKVDPGNLVDLSSYSDDQKMIWETHIRALLQYHPRQYRGTVHLFRSGGHPLWCSFEPDYGWGEVVKGEVKVAIVPGAHERVLEEPCVRSVAARLQSVLAERMSVVSGPAMSAAAVTAATGVAAAGLGLMGAEMTEVVSQGVELLSAVAAPGALMGRGDAAKSLPDPGTSDEDKQGGKSTKFELTKTFAWHFAKRVKQTPEAVAVYHTGATWTYRQLDERASKIANRLAQVGIKPGMLVGVCLDRSPDLVAGLLAVWKCGAGYLPLDPKYPRERLEYMLEDSQAAVLVTEKAFLAGFSVPAERVLVLDDSQEQSALNAASPVFDVIDQSSDALAYVIYTSGSTGKPKGVEIPHRSLLNHNFAIIEAYNLSAKDRVLQFSPISFDISVEEIFPTLLCGASLVLRTEAVISSVKAFFEFVRAREITVLNIPTAYWHEMVEHLGEASLPDPVRLVVIGGEKASDEAFLRWKRHVDSRRVVLINSYGPTETTVTATYFIPGPDDEKLTIGKPLANVQVAVLGPDMRRVPPGETGELFIGGEGLARGYLRRPDVTAERFVKNPFPDIFGVRLYRTGDLVRFREDGNLEFVGRTDHQVKIRGFRIELGEIESTLLSHPKVKDAVATVREDKPGQKKLVGYLVARNGESLHVTDLLEFLRSKMPAYMVPSHLVILEAMPMTPAGKIDRLALPAPGWSRPVLEQEYVAPRTPLESALASIYQEVLEFDRVGVMDNFFDLGGHSLAATQVIARARDLFKVEVPLSIIFSCPTVAQAAEQVEQLAGGNLVLPFSAVAGSKRAELTPGQVRLWFLDQFDPQHSPYNLPVALRLIGPIDIEALNWSLTSLAERHPALRSIFPEENGVPVQYVCEPSVVTAKLIDLVEVPANTREEEARKICTRESRVNYITRNTALRPLLIKLSDREHLLLILLHRIAVDWRETNSLLRELTELYDARAERREPAATGRDSGVKPLVSPRADTISGTDFWNRTLQGLPEATELPSDRPRSNANRFEGARLWWKLPQRVGRLLESTGQGGEPICLAAFFTLLHRYTGSEDLVAGTTILRSQSHADGSALASFEDYLVLRQRISSESSFETFVRSVEQTLQNARQHQAEAFCSIVERLHPPRHSYRMPVFQTLFHFEQEPEFSASAGGVSFVPIEVDEQTALFDVSLRLRKRGRQYWLSLRYRSDLFDRERMERMARHYCNLLLAGLEQPGLAVARLPLMDEAEQERVLSEWIPAELPYAPEKTVVRLFDDQVRRSPQADALVVGSERFSYRALSEFSARVAARLRALGVGTEGRVALCMEHSMELLPAILGIFRTGATCLPIAPTYGTETVAAILEDANPVVVLTDRKLAAGLPKGSWPVLCLEEVGAATPTEDLYDARPGDLAWLLYQAGDTGLKGVMIEHRNLVGLVNWVRNNFGRQELSGVLANSSIASPSSLFELFAPLCLGGTVILAKRSPTIAASPGEHPVRLMHATPTQMRDMLTAGGIPESVETILLTGEPASPDLVNQIHTNTKVKRVLELHGQPETTGYATWAALHPNESTRYAKPLTNVRACLLDSHLQPVPIGIPGELFIGGDGIARGYLNRPEDTQRRFIDDPFAADERLFRTGRIARWRQDGTLDYLVCEKIPSQGSRPVPSGILQPRTETETQLLSIWKAVLSVSDLGVTKNFFEAGGHSLLALRVIASVRESMGLELPLCLIFENPTVEGLARQIDSGKWAVGGQCSVIRRVPRDRPLPASFVQEKLWFLDQLDPGSDAYNVPAALRLRGKLDPERLERALQHVVARHEALRTTFAFEEGTLVQRIFPELRLPLAIVDLSKGGEDVEASLRKRLQEAVSRPFDLAAGPLVRALLFRLAEEEHVLLLAMHHTVTDGWSLAILFKELEAFYSAPANSSEQAGLEPLPLQYADYAQWHRETMSGPVLESELRYWKDAMHGAPTHIEFPRNGQVGESMKKAGRLRINFSEELMKALGRKSQESGTTPFAVLMAALYLVLSKWTGQKELVIGTVVAGRGRRELENLIGCFMNFLPIRMQVRPDLTAGGFLQEVRDRLLEAQSHQDCPFEKIVEAINPARQHDSNPLYNVALLWQNFPHDLFEGEGLETSVEPVAASGALLDLRFEAEQQGDELSIACEFRAGMFEETAISRLLASLQKVVEILAGHPNTPLTEIEIDASLSAAPRNPEPEPSRGKIPLAIAGTFTTEPLAESVDYWAGELGMDLKLEFAPYNQIFQELLNPSSLLGQNTSGANVALLRFEDWIRDKTQPSSETARLEIGRNLKELAAAIKSLAARNTAPLIVSICPPSAKIASSPECVRLFSDSESFLKHELEALPGAHLLSYQEVLGWYSVPDYNDPAAEELGHVPYTPLFYTALGTALVRKLHSLRRSPPKVIVLDCDNTLWGGVCGEDGPSGVKLDEPWRMLQEFMRLKRESGILLALCSKNNPEDVEEVFSRRHDLPLKRHHFAAVRLNWKPKSENLRSLAAELNLGLDSFIFIDDNPVECAEVEANCPEVLTLQLPEDPNAVPAFLRHCWVFDQAKLTAEDRKRAEMYRQNSAREKLRTQSSTLADFIAGLDLKIRIEPMTDADVSRVAQLTQRTNQFNMTTRRRTEADVRALTTESAVLVVHVSDRFGDYGLVGVMIARTAGESLDVDTFLLSCRVLGRGVEHKMLSQLGEFARERRLRWVDLRYVQTAKNRPALNFLEMTAGSFKQHSNGGLLFRLPAGFAAEVIFNVQSAPVEVAPGREMKAEPMGRSEKFHACRAIALHSNDITKVHKRIERKNTRLTGFREAGSAPETDMERRLVEIWSKLLRRQDVGVTENFFDLGGYSLLAVRLFAEIERVTARKFPLVTLFQAPTIRELARVLQREQHERKPAGAEALLVPIQPQGDLPPLFLVHGAGGDVLWGYANLAAHLGAERPIYGLKSRGQVGLEECSTIPEMAACYVEAVRTRQPHGPYYLGGYCFGGNVAYEMARLLQQQGESVALVALLDSSPSNAGYETPQWGSPVFAYRFVRNALYWLLDFWEQPLRDQVRFIVRKSRAIGRKLRAKITRAESEKVDLDEIIDVGHFPDHELTLWRTHILALVEHTDQPYEGAVVLFRTRGQPVFCSFAEDFCWGKLAKRGVDVVRIPGSHENIFMEPNVRVLAMELGRAISTRNGVQAVRKEAAAL